MGRTKGTYTLTSNIEPKVGAPLDARTIVKLLVDLTANNTFEYPYKGMKVFVEENNKSYTLVGSDPTISSNWTEDGSGGGHVIKNQTGTDMNQRSNLQFVDMTLSDDAINDITKVENIHVIQSESELANLPDGLYMLDDDEGTVIDGNEVGYDNTDSGLVSRNIQDAIDELAQGGGGGGTVTDVKVNDVSVVDQYGAANIDLTGYAEKSDLGTASALDVAVSGDASTSQVVKGDDTRLTNARPASDVSSWAKASTKPEYTASEVGAIATTAKGTANGVAELDENGKVPSAQLPSYVDDVLEYSSISAFPATGESGKIYVALDTNKTYRWSGTEYVEISESLALGETSSTAYAGNKGKQNADNIATIQGLIPSTATTSNKLVTASDINSKLNTTTLASSEETEATTTASKAHAKDSKFYLAATQQYCMAKTAIAIGDTLVENTNYIAITINGFLTDLEVYLILAGQMLDTKVDKVAGKGLSHNDFVANNAVLTTDKTPFLTRQTLNLTGFSGYVREKLVGASYAWNQLVQNGNFADGTTSWTCIKGSVSVSNGIATVTPSQYDCQIYESFVGRYVVGHKYLVSVKLKTSGTSTAIRLRFLNGYKSCELVNTWQTLFLIVNADSNVNPNFQYVWLNDLRSADFDAWQCTDFQVIDLTLAFGRTIADYLYGLSNNGGVTKLRNMGCPIDKYTAYGYGLYSVKTSGKKIVGKNKFNIVDVYSGISVDGNSMTKPSGSFNYDIYSGNTGQSQASAKKLYLVAGTYVITFTNNATDYSTLFISDIDETTLTPVFSNWATISSDDTFVVTKSAWFCIKIVSQQACTIGNLQIELGSQATTYESYSSTTYSLGNDELRGKFDLVDGEIVASGDVKESNGEITRNWGIVDLGTLTYSYSTSMNVFYANLPNDSIQPIQGGYDAVCAKYACYTGSYSGQRDKSFSINNVSWENVKRIWIKDSAYSDTTALKNSLDSVYLVYPLATPTTEQSTPFADPMSMIGATTEEYIDTRDIPCPVGAERQYMGQSEDIIEIPSMPQSDGIRYMKAITSGGKTQLVWEDDIIEDVSDCFTAGNAFTSISYCQACKVNRTVTFRIRYTRLTDSVAPVIIMLDSKIRPLTPYQPCFRMEVDSGLGLIEIADGGSAGGMIIDGDIVVNQNVKVSGTFLTKN